MPTEKKECPPGKVLNEKTNRCVKKDGRIGQSIKPAKKTTSSQAKPVPKKTKKTVSPAQLDSPIKDQPSWHKAIQSLYPCILQLKGTRLHLAFSKEEFIIKATNNAFVIVTFNENAEENGRKTNVSINGIDAFLQNKKGCKKVYLSLDHLNKDRNVLKIWDSTA